MSHSARFYRRRIDRTIILVRGRLGSRRAPRGNRDTNVRHCPRRICRRPCPRPNVTETVRSIARPARHQPAERLPLRGWSPRFVRPATGVHDARATFTALRCVERDFASVTGDAMFRECEPMCPRSASAIMCTDRFDQKTFASETNGFVSTPATILLSPARQFSTPHE